MSIEDYKRAEKAGRKDYQSRMLHGKRPTLEVLDDIIDTQGHKQVSLGLVQIPIDQIVGTRYNGRSNAFAGNFMPLMEPGSEFASKWSNLSTAHENEGIREPIKAWEYMNRFYIEEGNKRVSVMKYFEAISIPGTVTRILPKRTGEEKVELYYEFVEFYALSSINYIEFSRAGSYARLQKAVGKAPDESWTDDDRINFSSAYTRFSAAYLAKGGKKLSITCGDAFLSFITLYGYANVCDCTTEELKKQVQKAWEEFTLLTKGETVSLKMDPGSEKKPLISRILSGTSAVKVAFVYEKTATASAWTYAHELGRLHLNETFPQEVVTVAYPNITKDTIDACLEEAICEGCDILFTTSPIFASASVKAAIAHPEVHILNCSLNTSHRYIHTYYARMHEAKFLMGAIAGALAENNRLFYLADYPLFGTIANINAFALGARMVNPRAEVHLEWFTKKDVSIDERIRQVDPACISGRDMVIPQEASRFFGVYRLDTDGRAHNLAMPLTHWGRFYEKLIRGILNGSSRQDDKTGKAVNYWWGMSADVVEVICSKSLPAGTKQLVELLRQTIQSGTFNPFSGTLFSQTGRIHTQPMGGLTPEQVMKMDWLAENVIGAIPKDYELIDPAKPVVAQQGVALTS